MNDKDETLNLNNNEDQLFKHSRQKRLLFSGPIGDGEPLESIPTGADKEKAGGTKNIKEAKEVGASKMNKPSPSKMSQPQKKWSREQEKRIREERLWIKGITQRKQTDYSLPVHTTAAKYQTHQAIQLQSAQT